MARLRSSQKACSLDPLKSSAPLGATLAFLGIDGAVPLFHGAQGCTSFALVLAVRHFREAIPLQTTALDEVSTILGGASHIEQALVNLKQRMNPRLIGIASTALVETRGEDLASELREILHRRSELAGTAIVFASTPDFEGALEDGWAKATSALIEALVPPDAACTTADAGRVVNVLPGVHETPGDVDELRRLIEAFGLEARIVPDLSSSLDGHVPEHYVATSLGGARIEDIERMGVAAHTSGHRGPHAKARKGPRGADRSPYDRVPDAVGPRIDRRAHDSAFADLPAPSALESPSRTQPPARHHDGRSPRRARQACGGRLGP